jgi:hypothetical protein
MDRVVEKAEDQPVALVVLMRRFRPSSELQRDFASNNAINKI